MVESSFESLVESIAASIASTGSSALALDSALATVVKRQSERETILSALAPGEKISQGARDCLVVFDVIAAACAVALGNKGEGAVISTPLGAEVTDLWIQATAARALWFERYAKWPHEDSQKKEGALLATAKEVGGVGISIAARLGGQPTQFTAFVASLANLKTP